MAYDRSHCAACGSQDDLHEHHLVPKSQGGAGLPTVYLCVPCHAAAHTCTRWDADHMTLVRAGVARAKAEGKYKGRAPMVAQQRDMILALYASGKKPTHIAKQLGIARSSVYRMLK